MLYVLNLYRKMLTFSEPGKKSFENTVEKGVNAGNWHFIFLPKSFLPYHRKSVPFEPQ